MLLAREHLKVCIQEEPEAVWPYLQRALAAGELRDFDAAEADFAQAERLLRDAPDDTALYALFVNRGVNRIGKGNPEGAVADLTRAVPPEAGRVRGLPGPGEGVSGTASLGQSRRTAEPGCRPDSPAGLAAVYRSRAMVEQQQNDLEAAARDLKQAAPLEPDGKDSPAASADFLLMGRLLMGSGKYEDAVRAADTALTITADDPAAHRFAPRDFSG